MDSIEILEPPKHALGMQSSQQGIQELLETSMGYPKRKNPFEAPEKLATFDSPKLKSTHRVLGAVYWIDSSAIMKSHNKLQKDFEFLHAEAKASMVGWGGPRLRFWYMHSARPDLVGIPRFLGLSLFGLPERDIRSLGEPIETHKVSNRVLLQLRPEQHTCIDKTLTTLEAWGGATVIADCGFGKTRIAIGLLSELKRKTLIVCNREVLMLQWASVIQFLLPSCRIAWLQGSSCFDRDTIKVDATNTFLGPKIPNDITIASIDTLIEADVPKEIISSYGLAIFDEAHHLAAKTLMHATPRVPARYIVGLSATPDRRDGLEHTLYWLLGPTSFVYKRLPSVTGIRGAVEIQKVVPQGTACREIFRFDGSLAFAEMITGLSEDTVRNNIIIAILDQLATTRHKIIVVSSLVNHCVGLADSFLTRCPSVPVARMAGKFQERELALARSTKVVFATYSLLEEGYDDIYLDTLVLVTPRSRIQQTIGRIERTHAEKLRPLVIDIVDPYSVFPQMWYKRCVFYRSRGFLIEDTSK